MSQVALTMGAQKLENLSRPDKATFEVCQGVAGCL